MAQVPCDAGLGSGIGSGTGIGVPGSGSIGTGSGSIGDGAPGTVIRSMGGATICVPRCIASWPAVRAVPTRWRAEAPPSPGRRLPAPASDVGRQRGEVVSPTPRAAPLSGARDVDDDGDGIRRGRLGARPVGAVVGDDAEPEGAGTERATR